MLTAAASVRFDRSVGGPQNEALRAKLASLWSPEASPLIVASAIAMLDELEHERLREPEAAGYLLFELDHLFLYRRTGATSGALPSLHSLVSYVVEFYSPRPLAPLRPYCRDRTFQFRYPLDTLDVLADLWSALQPGYVMALNCGAGEIRTVRLPPHPDDVVVRRARPTGPTFTHAEARCLPDDSLRQSGPQSLLDAAPECEGMIRGRQLRWSRLSLPIASAIAAANGSRTRTACFGKGLRCREAEAVAGLEVLERMHVAMHWSPGQLSYGSYRDMSPRAVDPRTLCYERPGDEPPNGLHQYDADVPLYWTEATHVISGETLLVPAQEIWFCTDQLPGEHRFIRTTTNGCAIGSDHDEAALFALFEAIERDAYLTMWYTRRPCQRIDLDAIDDERCRMIHERWRLCLPQYEIHLFDITNDTAVPAVAAIALRSEAGPGPRTMHAAAARTTVVGAVRAALADLASLVPHESPSVPEAREILSNPDLIRRPWHHFLLYSLDDTFDRLSFLPWQGQPIRPEDAAHDCLDLRSETRGAGALVDTIARHLQTLEIEVYLKDLTFPWLAHRQVRCVKAVTPGLFPIWFGGRNPRFRVTDRLRRLARQYVRRPLTEPSDFNLEIHPFS